MAVENIAHERRLSGAAHAGHYGEHIKGHLHVDILQIMLGGTLDLHIVAPLAATGRARNRQRSVEIAGA